MQIAEEGQQALLRVSWEYLCSQEATAEVVAVSRQMGGPRSLSSGWEEEEVAELQEVLRRRVLEKLMNVTAAVAAAGVVEVEEHQMLVLQRRRQQLGSGLVVAVAGVEELAVGHQTAWQTLP